MKKHTVHRLRLQSGQSSISEPLPKARSSRVEVWLLPVMDKAGVLESKPNCPGKSYLARTLVLDKRPHSLNPELILYGLVSLIYQGGALSSLLAPYLSKDSASRSNFPQSLRLANSLLGLHYSKGKRPVCKQPLLKEWHNGSPRAYMFEDKEKRVQTI